MNTWEDTVLKENQIGSRPLYCFADEEMIRLGLSRLELFRLCKDAGFLNTQAELTYHSRDSEVAEARKAGIKEVVEWVETHGHIRYTPAPLRLKELAINHSIWQAQLKEWGIKEE